MFNYFRYNRDRQLKGATKTEGLPAQVFALSRAIMSYAANIDRLEVLTPMIIGIAHKHVSRGVMPFQCTWKIVNHRLHIFIIPSLLTQPVHTFHFCEPSR